MIDKIKELRVEIDGLHQLLSRTAEIQTSFLFGSQFQSAEITRSLNALILGKAWLGKLLGELDVPSPYPNDGTRSTVAHIEPTADRFEGIEDRPKNTTYITEIDSLRQRISKLTDTLKGWGMGRNWGASVARTNAYSSLCEARFWLGFEFERIKKKADKGKK